eukprot:2364289-Pleurochrysis_carterae.AAC.4
MGAFEKLLCEAVGRSGLLLQTLAGKLLWEIWGGGSLWRTLESFEELLGYCPHPQRQPRARAAEETALVRAWVRLGEALLEALGKLWGLSWRHRVEQAVGKDRRRRWVKNAEETVMRRAKCAERARGNTQGHERVVSKSAIE